jgi:dynein heavy chain
LESLIQSIQLKTAAATKSRDEQQIKQASARDQAKLIEKEKVNADSALMEALPAVEAAADALNRIRREDLQELKAFNNPPIHVKIVCQMCTVLRPTHDFLEETWTDAKKLLGHPKLLESLKAYPKDQMTDKMYQRCKKILHDNKVHNITIETMATKSQAGKGLLVWVFAILRYYEVAKNVAPLRSKVKRMQKEQTKTEAELKELEQSLNKSDIEVKILRVSYNEASIELSELQLQASEMEKHLLASSHLVKNLDQESRRWREEMDRLQMYRSQLLGNNLIGAAYLSYFGAFDNDFRFRLQEQLLNHLTKLNLANNSYFQLKELVLSKTELQCWNANGLPADKHSIENGILTMHSSTYPLCIDPQGQVVTWIKKTFEHSHLCVHSLSDKDYMKHLQIAVEYGHPFLFENVSGDIDSNLDNILDFPMSKNQESIMIGEKIVNWNPNFRLFFCTRLANPSFSPGMVEKIHLINCCISPEGLTEQLLNMVVSHEKPVSMI